MGFFKDLVGALLGAGSRVVEAEVKARTGQEGAILDQLKDEVEEKLEGKLSPEAIAEVHAILDEVVGAALSKVLSGQVDKIFGSSDS